MQRQKSPAAQALNFCLALKRDTEPYGHRWRSIQHIATRARLEDPAAAILLAVSNGWLEVVADRSVGLTAEGLRLR